MSVMIDEIKKFMEESLEIDTKGLASDEPLFSTGILDSFSLVTLLSFVEDTYKFKIGLMDVNLANFDTLDKMVSYIERSLEQ